MNLAIDFGTSYTKLALWQDGQMIDLLGTGRIPSVATYVPDLDKLFFGFPAIQLENENNLSTHFFKLHLKRNPAFKLGPHQLEALLGKFFFFLQEYYVLPRGIRPASINLSIPNNFGLKSRRILINAAQNAFAVKDIILLPEPLAALVGYNNAHPGQTISGDWLIVDVGGGTVDFSFMSVFPDHNTMLLESQFQVGQDAFSGSEVDRMVLRRLIAPAFTMQHGIELPRAILNEVLDSSDAQYWFYKWMQLAEDIKIQIASKEFVKFSVNNFYEDYNLDLSFNRTVFKEAVSPVFERLRRYWEEGVYERARALGFAGSSGWNLDGVLLLGGGALTPSLAEEIGKFCPGVPIIRPEAPDLYVIRGLSRWPEQVPTDRMKLKTIYPFRFYREQRINSRHELKEIPFDSSHLELDFAGRYEICSLSSESPDNISEDPERFAVRVYEAAEEDPRPELQRFLDQEPVFELNLTRQELDGPINIYLNLSKACLELDNNDLLSECCVNDNDLFYKIHMKQRAAYKIMHAYKFMDEMLAQDYARQLERDKTPAPEAFSGTNDSQIALYKLLSLMNIFGDK